MPTGTLKHDYVEVSFDETSKLMSEVCSSYDESVAGICRRIGISASAWAGWAKQNSEAKIQIRACYFLALQMLEQKRSSYQSKQQTKFTSDDYLFIARTAKEAGNVDLAYKAMEGFLDG